MGELSRHMLTELGKLQVHDIQEGEKGEKEREGEEPQTVMLTHQIWALGMCTPSQLSDVGYWIPS